MNLYSERQGGKGFDSIKLPFNNSSSSSSRESGSPGLDYANLLERSRRVSLSTAATVEISNTILILERATSANKLTNYAVDIRANCARSTECVRSSIVREDREKQMRNKWRNEWILSSRIIIRRRFRLIISLILTTRNPYISRQQRFSTLAHSGNFSRISRIPTVAPAWRHNFQAPLACYSTIVCFPISNVVFFYFLPENNHQAEIHLIHHVLCNFLY